MTIKPQILPPDIATIATYLGCKPAAIRAVDTVESGGRGFYVDGRLIILFEPHIFWKQLKVEGINPETHRATFPGILSPVWDPKLYEVGGTSWTKLDRAVTIHREAALRSCSWGRYQILGLHHKMLGFDTAQKMVNFLNVGEPNHLQLFARFIKKTGLDDELVHEDWAGFARGYNGALYYKNKYDVKLKTAFDKFNK